MKPKEREHFIECECGARVYGISEAHAKSLLPIHKRSKKHKELMEIKKRENDRRI